MIITSEHVWSISELLILLDWKHREKIIGICTKKVQKC